MGAIVSCFSNEEVNKKRRPPSRRRPPAPSNNHGSQPLPELLASSSAIGSSSRWGKARSSRRDRVDGVLTNEEALAAARLLLQDSSLRNGGGGVDVLPFDRSASLRYPNPYGHKKQALPRSSSSRPRSLTDPPLQPQQLINQDIKVDELETDRFVLVHGGGFGAWCWYKTIALLEEVGFKVDAIELTGSGVNSFDTNKITSFSTYVKPLTDYLEKIGDGVKVILVGHDIGGACISYAMETFPAKIAKSVFISAAMLTNGQSLLYMFSQQAGTYDLMQQAKKFVYANGSDQPPTAIDLDKSMLKELLFNQSPSKDVALASVSMRLIPFAPLLEKLSLSKENYGSIRRYYIETTEDSAIPLTLQQSMCNSNPPERVFILKGADHAPFFSKPQALHKFLVEISKIKQPKSLSQLKKTSPLLDLFIYTCIVGQPSHTGTQACWQSCKIIAIKMLSNYAHMVPILCELHNF